MFFYTRSRYTTGDIESQVNQHSSNQSSHIPPQTPHITNHIESQYSGTQSFERNPDHNPTYTLSQTCRSSSNPEIQHDDTQTLYTPSHKDYTVDLESQYSNISPPGNHVNRHQTYPNGILANPNALTDDPQHLDTSFLSKLTNLFTINFPTLSLSTIRSPEASPHHSKDSSSDKKRWQCIPSSIEEDLESGKVRCDVPTAECSECDQPCNECLKENKFYGRPFVDHGDEGGRVVVTSENEKAVVTSGNGRPVVARKYKNGDEDGSEDKKPIFTSGNGRPVVALEDM
ncbi:hypothetical protein NHQ30_009625 [Ciborinia camelliae]|nr:hypothetical protein NHQ30_009625 [Ciborinia camelliae]